MQNFIQTLLSSSMVAVPLILGMAGAVNAQSAESGTMERADADMREVLLSFKNLGPKPLETLTPEQARQQPTPADAVAALLKTQGKDPAKMRNESRVATQDVEYAGASGEQTAARIYKPEGAPAQGLPVILYIHGGGWVIADLDVYDASPRALAAKANALVISVHYRQAPEHKFPASHDDTFAAYKWVLENAQRWGGDARRIAVAGESAGGNMALTVAMAARDQNLQLPVHIVAVYPVAGTNLDTPSYIKNENAMPLSKAGMRWFFKHATTQKDLSDPRLDIVKAADLKGLPPVTLINAEIDPLLSDGELLAKRLEEAGVRVTAKTYDGVTHEFFGMDAVVKDAAAAQEFAAQELKSAFGNKSAAQ